MKWPGRLFYLFQFLQPFNKGSSLTDLADRIFLTGPLSGFLIHALEIGHLFFIFSHQVMKLRPSSCYFSEIVFFELGGLEQTALIPGVWWGLRLKSFYPMKALNGVIHFQQFCLFLQHLDGGHNGKGLTTLSGVEFFIFVSVLDSWQIMGSLFAKYRLLLLLDGDKLGWFVGEVMDWVGKSSFQVGGLEGWDILLIHFTF